MGERRNQSCQIWHKLAKMLELFFFEICLGAILRSAWRNAHWSDLARFMFPKRPGNTGKEWGVGKVPHFIDNRISTSTSAVEREGSDDCRRRRRLLRKREKPLFPHHLRLKTQQLAQFSFPLSMMIMVGRSDGLTCLISQREERGGSSHLRSVFTPVFFSRA